MSLEIARTLILSTAHISQESIKHLDQLETIYKCEYGVLLSTYKPESSPARWPDDVETVLEFARANDCAYIMWDRDAGEIAGLPTYNW